MSSYVDTLEEQIDALGLNSKVAVQILREVDARGNVTYNEINVALKKQEINTTPKSLYRYLDKLTKAGILKSVKQRPKEWRIRKRILYLAKKRPPSVRFSGSTEHWGSSGRAQIVDSLIRELDIDIKEAGLVARRVEEYACGLGYVLMKNIWKGTIRSLVVEVLQEMSERAKDEYDKRRLENMAFKYSDIGWSWKHLESVLSRLSTHGIHPQSPAKRILCNINLRRLPDDLRMSSERGSTIYFHGLSNVFRPLTINHDMRWFFQFGVKTQFHSSRPPRYLNSALASVCTVLAMCRPEVGGSQNIDHFNLLVAPFVEKLERFTKKEQYENELKQHIDAFISEVWRLYITRPMDPVFSSVTLEYENSPVEHFNVIMEGEEKENHYSDYWEYAKQVADVLLEVMCRKKEENAYAPIYPRIFLKVSADSLNDQSKMSSRTIEAVMSILKLSDPKRVPIYFVNTDSTLNKVPGSHVSYSCEIQRIASNGMEDDQRKGILTFVSLNLQKIRAQTKKLEKENLDGILSHLEDMIKKVMYFDLRKRTEMRSRLKTRDLMSQITGQVAPHDPDHKYFDIDHSSLHIGLTGLAHLYRELNTPDEAQNDAISEIVDFLKQLKTIMDNLSQAHSIPILLSQTPGRSGAYYKFFRSSQPTQEHVNILPFISSSLEEQLRIESKIHSIMAGGSISRMYFLREELPRNDDEFRELLMKAIEANVPLFKIIPQERVSA